MFELILQNILWNFNSRDIANYAYFSEELVLDGGFKRTRRSTQLRGGALGLSMQSISIEITILRYCIHEVNVPVYFPVHLGHLLTHENPFSFFFQPLKPSSPVTIPVACAIR